ncbi:DUF1906 domain-containing protein [Streptacidiphilus griseoplanus]|uniref:DUF1906 domain-containing protein n=1 Tax=Peterkaempfera griseoplana TaxID=66896 RepID=UPI000ACDC7B7|nr:DUF1906 domain-containing protein [Peterkaempfera griseoplana]
MHLPRPAALMAAVLVLLAPPGVLTAAQPAQAAPLPVRHFAGHGFDACAAPSLTTMRRWHRHSRYRAVGIYFGGVNRSCAQPHLTAHWVRAVDRMGWRLLPVYAGLQAPCRRSAHRLHRIDPRRAGRQGAAQAADAARRARALGLAKGSPLYLDMENYRRGNARCSRAVVDFSVGWTRGLNRRGYRSGFYSSAGSGIADLAAARRRGRRDLPGTLWYAHWNGRPGTGRAKGLSSRAWHGHRRIHQYRGNVRESHGGSALTVDRSTVDAPVALVARRSR